MLATKILGFLIQLSNQGVVRREYVIQHSNLLDDQVLSIKQSRH